MADDLASLPDVGAVLAGVLARLPRQRQPLLIAIAERMAADRYRAWAAAPGYEAHRDALQACARREEEIAARIEALYPDAAAVQADIHAHNPDLADITRDLFAERPVAQQLAIQAQGERLGAATWRAFAAARRDTASVFEACAQLEEHSAEVLDAILATTAPSEATGSG